MKFEEVARVRGKECISVDRHSQRSVSFLAALKVRWKTWITMGNLLCRLKECTSFCTHLLSQSCFQCVRSHRTETLRPLLYHCWSKTLGWPRDMDQSLYLVYIRHPMGQMRILKNKRDRFQYKFEMCGQKRCTKRPNTFPLMLVAVSQFLNRLFIVPRAKLVSFSEIANRPHR